MQLDGRIVTKLQVLGRRAAGLLAVLLLSGCVQREVGGGRVVAGFAPWIIALVASLCPIALLAGLYVPRLSMKAKTVLIGTSLVVAIAVVPALFLDRFEVDRSGFRLRTGIWFAPRIFDIRFIEVETLSVPRSQVASQRRASIRARLRSGETRTIPQGDLMTQCLEDVAKAAAAAGVRVLRPK